jgi:cytochrome c oxidase subunit 2
MIRNMPDTGGGGVDVVLAGAGGLRAPSEVFSEIFVVFLGLGTLVGVVVVSYTLYNAYKYRYREDVDPAPEADRPELGELPEGGGKGRKLFLSFGLSAVIVLSLVLWTYGTLLYVENTPENFAESGDGEMLDVHVEGYRFGWSFTYPNGHTTTTLRVPEDRLINLTVTTRDVFHNFGIPEMRVKSDAIPGQTTNTWFVAENTGEYRANCYELCGSGHSYMTAEVVVMEPDAYGEWYAETNGTASNGTAANGSQARVRGPTGAIA